MVMMRQHIEERSSKKLKKTLRRDHQGKINKKAKIDLEERSSRESVKTLLDLLVERKAEAALKSSSKSDT